MTLIVDDQGRGNRLVAHGQEAHGALHVTFRGDGSAVHLGSGSTAIAARFSLGSRSTVEIGAGVRMAALEIHAADDVRIAIGAGTGLTWALRIHAHEAADVTIGAGCLISDACWITVSDMHSIVDKATGARINPPRPVAIGDRVWLANSVTLLKGARIGEGAVIGFGSTVTGEIPPECLAVGTPAKVVRRGITWNETLI